MSPEPIEVPDWIRSVVILDPTDVWGNVVGMGLSGLAAILSGAKRFDYRGDAFFIDGFEHGMASWVPADDGEGAAVELSTTRVLFSGFSVKLTGGAEEDEYATIGHYQFYPSDSKLGFELAISIDGNLKYFEWGMVIYTGSRGVVGKVRYVYAAQKLQYRDSGGVYRDFPTTVRLGVTGEVFHAGKLVVDPVTEKYVRFLLNKNEYDMSTLACEGWGDELAPEVNVYGQAVSNGEGGAVVYVDNAVLTQNEPV